MFCVSDVIFIRLFEFVDSRFIAGGCQVFEKKFIVAKLLSIVVEFVPPFVILILLIL